MEKNEADETPTAGASQALTAAQQRDLANQAVRDLQARAYLDRVIRPKRYIRAGRDWAASDEVVAYMIDYVLNSSQPKTILELGSGISTIWFGLATKQKGCGHVISIEHDAHFFEVANQLRITHEITDVVDLKLAPLAGGSDDRPPWYDLPHDFKPSIDLLFVDGPPARLGPSIRTPAFPRLAQFLNQGSLVVLDDTSRLPEQQIVQTWQSHPQPYGSLELKEDLGGATVMTFKTRKDNDNPMVLETGCQS